MDRLGVMAQFVRVVEAGSFSAAARVLGQGQPAISKAVAQMEDRLGVRLLTRTTRAVATTDAGRIFYNHARAALDAVEEAEAAARGAGTALSGRLRVCAPVTLARLHIVPSLPAFLAAHPKLELELILDDRRIDLIEEGIDLAIRAGPLADSSMVATHIVAGQRLVVGSTRFWAAQRPVERPADLAAMPFIAYGAAPGGCDWIFAHDGKTELVRMDPCLRTSALEGVREAIFAGLGFSIVSEWVVRNPRGADAIEPRLQAYQLPTINVWAIYPAGRQPSARARAFSAHVQTAMRAVTISP
jgi:DNA-binding transcriptional LysR family regulator